MTLTITPAKLAGAVTPPPSKSQAHRFLIAAALAGKGSVIHNLADSQDIQATRRCLEEIGPWVGPMSPLRRLALPELDCGESGSTLRFLIPVALALRGGGRFTGRGRLMERPQKPYFDLFEEKGIFYEQKDGFLTVQGLLSPGKYRLPGNVSSQFITGLLYALPLLEGDSEIMLTSPLESRGYVDMTLDALNRFGIRVEAGDYSRFFVPGNQSYQPAEATVEADWSQAGFWYAARCLGNPVELRGLDPCSAQGDSVIDRMAAELSAPGSVELDVSDCPDLVPPLAAIAALRAGQTTRIVNAGRLRIKESDRLATVCEELCKLGAQIEEGPDFLVITGVEILHGAPVTAHNDHRIAMMVAIAATRCHGPVTLAGAESVRKSYPNFWEDYVNLGGQIAPL